MDAKQQWELVAGLRRELQRQDEKAPWPGMEDDWQTLDISSDPRLKREGADFAAYVLPSITSWIEYIDAYPPPEMMLALCTMFRRYMDAAGTLTLEEAFFGRPRQRQGSYAARSAKRDPCEMGFVLAFQSGKHNGMTDTRAAAYAQRETERQYRKTFDADTMLRKMRRKRARTK